MDKKKILSELQRVYPNLIFEEYPYLKDRGVCYFTESHTISMSFPYTNITPADHALFRDWNRANFLKKEWELVYPFLYFSISLETFLPDAIWVRRGKRGVEAITRPTNWWRNGEWLEEINEQAGLAVQEGWFFCTGCNKAYRNSEHGYHHFAGSYCKKCKEDDPQAFRRAQQERYN